MMLRCKIHNATVTQAELYYEGSLTLDRDLMDAAGLLENEWVQVVNVNTGARFETYIIEGERGSGTVCLNGAAARLGAVGDVVIILCRAMMDEEEARTYRPKGLKVDRSNRVIGEAR
jgi:aspartate 1-decarboxylase